MASLMEEQMESWYRQWTRVDRLYEEFAQRRGITMTALSVLRWLEQQGPSTQRALSQGLGYPKQTLSSLVQGLENQGYILRQTCQEDRRSSRIELTESGRALARQVLGALRAAERAAFDALGEQGRAAFTHYNEALTQALERAMDRKEGTS
ncbi:MAG: MarR family winged helix-turn-helix transcriptional regulator [Christensenellales bacterium]|jgi:DNA-binding MarR family transcriptional regulator